MESAQQTTQNFTSSLHQTLLKIPQIASSFFSKCFNRLSTTFQSIKDICGDHKKIVITASLASVAILYWKINRQKREKQQRRKHSQQNTHESSEEEQILDGHSDKQNLKELKIPFSDLKLTESYEFYSKQLHTTCLQIVQELSDSEEDDKVFFEIYRGYQETQ